jgi:hypothetical protein
MQQSAESSKPSFDVALRYAEPTLRQPGTALLWLARVFAIAPIACGFIAAFGFIAHQPQLVITGLISALIVGMAGLIVAILLFEVYSSRARQNRLMPLPRTLREQRRFNRLTILNFWLGVIFSLLGAILAMKEL